MTVDERLDLLQHEIEQLQEDMTRLAQWEASLQGQQQTLHDKMIKLEALAKSVVDGGDYDKPKKSKKELDGKMSTVPNNGVKE